MGNNPITKSKIARRQKGKKQIIKYFFLRQFLPKKRVFWTPHVGIFLGKIVFFGAKPPKNPKKTNN